MLHQPRGMTPSGLEHQDGEARQRCEEEPPMVEVDSCSAARMTPFAPLTNIQACIASISAADQPDLQQDVNKRVVPVREERARVRVYLVRHRIFRGQQPWVGQTAPHPKPIVN